MVVIKSIVQWQQLRKMLPASTILGLVPTMGNLHDGHVSLLKRAKAQNEITVLTIFINPTQFNDLQDLQRYPKTLEQDLQLAQACEIDYVLVPTAEELYADQYTFKIIEDHLSKPLEGECRSGHFTGMLTVVMKLLLIVRPTQAYFGEKDYQQLRLVQALVQAFFLDINIVPCPTIREPSGLALSSRNTFLTSKQKQQASSFYHQLCSKLPDNVITNNLEQLGFKVDYIARWQNRLLGAVWLDGVRLIDNIPLELNE